MALVAPQNEAMLDPFGLGVIERRQLSEGRGFGLVKNPFGHGL